MAELSSRGLRPIARILGGVVLFQEKVDLLKIENSMNMVCEACRGSGGMLPQEIF